MSVMNEGDEKGGTGGFWLMNKGLGLRKSEGKEGGKKMRHENEILM